MNARGFESLKIFPDLFVPGWIGTSYQRNLRALLTRQRECALGGYSFASSSDQQHIAGVHRPLARWQLFQTQITQDRFCPSTVGCIASFAVTDIRNCLLEDEFACLGMTERNADDGHRRFRIFQIKRTRERSSYGRSLRLHNHKPSGLPRRQKHPCSVKEQLDTSLIAFFAETNDDSAAGSRNREDLFQSFQLRMIRTADHTPGPRTARCEAPTQRPFDTLDGERTHPTVNPFQPGLATLWSPGAAACHFLQSLGNLGHAGIGHLSRSRGRGDAELPRRFCHELTNGDRIQMQVAQHPVLVRDRRKWQFSVFRYQGSDQLH